MNGFRLSLLINDNDGDGREGWLEFHSGIGYLKQRELYGTYSLE